MPKRRRTADGRASQPEPVQAGNLRRALEIALLVVATFVAYLPALNGGFLWDDTSLLTNNRLIKDAHGLYRIWFTTDAIDYWPVSNSALWLEWRLWGMNPLGYHVTSVLLHIAAALLIWLILRRLAIPGAYFAALLFALHPVNVESVAWIAQRKTILAMDFFLLSTFWYLKFDPLEKDSQLAGTNAASVGRRRWYWLSLIAFVLGMLSKGSIATLPLVLLLLVWWRRDRITPTDLVRVAPLAAAAATLVLVNLWFRTHGSDEVIRTARFAERLAGAGTVPWFYLSKAVWPLDLMFVYPQWNIDVRYPLWWAPLAAAVAVTVLLWKRRQSGWGRSLLVAWGFFWLMLVPVLGFVDVAFMESSLVADHYQYIAIMGVVAVAAAAWGLWYRQSRDTDRGAAVVLALVLVGIFSMLTWRQSATYKDSETMWRTVTVDNPEWFLGYRHLGEALFMQRRTPEAISAFERAVQLNPRHANSQNLLGVALMSAGRFPEAIERYQEALRLNPQFADAHNNWGLALLNMNRPAEAMEQYREAIRVKPDFAQGYYNLGVALANQGDFRQAAEQFQQVIEITPEDAEAHYALADMLGRTDRLPEAIEQLEIAVNLKSDYLDAWVQLAKANALIERRSQALEAGQRAMEVARAQNNQPVATQMSDWLAAYRSGQGAALPTTPNTSVTPPVR